MTGTNDLRDALLDCARATAQPCAMTGAKHFRDTLAIAIERAPAAGIELTAQQRDSAEAALNLIDDVIDWGDKFGVETTVEDLVAIFEDAQWGEFAS